MTRWALLSALDIGSEGDPYLDRLRLVQTPWFGVYLHHIHRADIERDLHDHPWWFASLVLTGAYVEEVRRNKADTERGLLLRRRGRWSLRCLDRNAAHRITSIRGPLWTLVLTGPRRGDWGFWPEGRFVPWQKYHFHGV